MTKEQLKNLFKAATIRRERDGWRDLEPRAMFDDIAQKWFVAIFFKLGRKQQSVIVLEGLDEEEAKKVEGEFKKLA